MRSGWIATAALAAMCAGAHAAPEVDATRVGPATKLDARAARAVMNRLPLAFETNRGQAPDGFDFLVRCRGYRAFVRSSGIVFAFDGDALAMSVDGAGVRAPTTDGLALAGRVNYFLGNDPSKWITEIPVVRGARYDDVAPATSWSVGGKGRALEFAFDLAPGADAPRLRFDGARGVRVADDGSLRVAMPTGEATISAPLAWQETGAGRVDAKAKFVLEKDGAVRVATSPRDPDRAVHVDPTVTYESYLGGASAEGCAGAAVDSTGAAYFGGSTTSTNFPTTNGAYATTKAGIATRYDFFVTKVNAGGTAFVWSTYVGGALEEQMFGFFLDAAGNVVFSGTSGSTDYPTTPGVVRTTPNTYYGVLTALAAAGNSLAYSSFTTAGSPQSIAPGPSGGVYVLDRVNSVSLYSAGATSTVFTKQIKPSSTIGGQGMNLSAVGSDVSGAAYVVGDTDMENYPATTGAYQTSYAGQRDAFLTKIRSDSTVAFTTYLGGAASENAFAVDVNLAGQAYVAGATTSSNFPFTSGAFRTSITTAGASDAFVTRFNAAGSGLRYSTYLGPGVAHSVRVHAGSSYVVAGDAGAAFPTSDAFQTFAGGYDAFLMKFDRFNALAWSSVCGGTGNENLGALGMGPDGSVALGGYVTSTDFPATNALIANAPGQGDGFIVKVPDSLPTNITPLAVTTSAAPTWTVGFPYAPFQLAATGGVGPYTWTLVGGSLPATMSFGTDGVVTGTPPQVGPYAFTVRVDDPTEMTATRQITLQVNPYPSIATTALPDATVSTNYDRYVAAVDGSGALNFTQVSGSIPPGFALGTDGRMTGTPLQTGDYSFAVGVTDARGATGSGPVTLRVNPFPNVVDTPTPAWTETRPYALQFGATGGTAPLVWSIAVGAAPTASLDSATGKLSGPAKTAGVYAFTLRATDANGAKAERAFAVAVNAYPTIANAVPPRLALGRPCSVKPVIAGGTPSFQWSLGAGYLPNGLVVDSATGEIAGVPTSAGGGEVRLDCADAAGAAASGSVFLTTAALVDLSKKRAAETVVLTPQSPPTVERYLELTANAVLGVVVSGGGSAAGGPRLRLFEAWGDELDLSAATKSTAKSVTLKKFVVPATGRYFLSVAPAFGSVGKMKVTTTIAPAATWTSSGDVGASAYPEFDFSAPPGSFVSISAKSVKPSLASPRIFHVTAPDGTDLVPGAKTVEKGRTASFSTKTPLAGGDYRVVFGPRDANAGAISWTVKLRLPGRYTFALPDVVAGE